MSVRKLAMELRDAASEGDLGRVARLLAQGANPRAQEPEFGRDALMLAAAGGRAECVAMLLPAADPTAQNSDGSTALMHAAGANAPDCLDLLLPVSDARAKAKDGWSALTNAVAADAPECVRRLLPVSDPLERDKNGWTALMHAARGKPECARLLLSASDPLAHDPVGQTALMIALSHVELGFREGLDAVRVLLPVSDLDTIGHQFASVEKLAARIKSEAGRQAQAMIGAERERRDLMRAVQAATNKRGKGKDRVQDAAPKSATRL